MEENIYAPPTTREPSIIEENQFNLASRLERLGASVLDSLFLSIITLPVMYFTGGLMPLFKGEEHSLLYTLGFGFFCLLAFALINFKFLIPKGQTLGKKIVGIRVIEESGQDTNNATLTKRYLFYFAISYIPFIGQFLSLINICFIFGKNQTCLHDIIAKTKVIKC